MEHVKKNDKYTIFKKSSGRHAVWSAAGKFINGAEKAQILVKEGVLKKHELPKAKAAAEAAPAADAPKAE
jgi:hypothetical protein